MSSLSLDRFKTCSKCGATKPAVREFWSPYRKGKFGLTPRCKDCLRLQTRDERAANPGVHAEYMRKRYWADPEKSREQVRQQAQRRFQRDRDKVLRDNREWRAANPEKVRQLKYEYKARRRARQLSAGGTYTVAEIQQMYNDQGGLCAYCEMPLRLVYEVDHMMPLSRGGQNDWTNLAVVCPSCNRTKSDKTTEQFMYLIVSSIA